MTLKHLFPGSIISLLLALIACSSALSQPFNPSITQMGNGLTVILQEDHSSELIGVDVWVKAGSRFETPKNNGVSHFIEHLLFGVTPKRGLGQMDREMESLGATLDAHTFRDYAHFSTTISSRYLTKALDIFADALYHSEFPDLSIRRERPVLLDEIARKQGNPAPLCQDLLAKAIYGDHSYALPVEGTRQTVASISRDDILDYYRRYYVPSNMAIVMVGDFNTHAAISAVGLAFQGGSTAALKEAAVQPIPHSGKQVRASLKAPFKNTYIGIAFPGPPASEADDACAMDVLISYFGRGYHNWLSDELKGRLGLVQAINADYLTQRDPGLVSVVAAAKPENIEKVKETILAHLDQLKVKGINQADLDRAKRSTLGQYAFQGETVGGRAGLLGYYYAVSDPAFAGKYPDIVQSVTNEAIKKVASKYLNVESSAVVTVGPDQGEAK